MSFLKNKYNYSFYPTGRNLLSAGHQIDGFWGKWMLVLALISIIYLIAMVKVPILYGDLFMNIDLGRIVLNPETDWAITWLTKEGQPVFLFNYLGIVLQEYVFQWVGLFGPMILTLLGALAAATLMAKWLLTRGIPGRVSFILSLVFLLDPLFVQSYTVGRLDSWAIALCLGVCVLLRSAIKADHSLLKSRLLCAGALAAGSFFTWPSAIFLFPLILWELSEVSSVLVYKVHGWKQKTYPLVLFGIGGLIGIILLILPIADKLYGQINDVIHTLQVNLRVESNEVPLPFYIDIFPSFIEVLRVLKFSPFLPLLALIGLVRQKNIGLILACVFSAGLMIATVVYVHRVLYLLPYFTVAVSFLFTAKKSTTDTSKTFLSLSRQTYVLSLLLIWAVSLSIATRTLLLLDRMNDNESEKLYTAAESMVGLGSQGVLTPFEFYPVGRAMGWKMYVPYTHIGAERLSFEELEPLIPLVNYAIIGKPYVTEDLAQQLTAGGLHPVGNFYLYDRSLPPDDGQNTNIKRLRNLYHIFPQPYGPYQLFAREGNKQSSFLNN
jgi:hypothetical protein